MKVLGAINDVLGLIPPLIWALALAAFGLLWWSTAGDLAATAKALDQKKQQYSALSGAVAQQNREAAARLATLTAQVASLQAAVNERHRAQEIRDANNAATIAQQARRLRDLSRDGGGRGLRDPNAPACGAGGGGGAPQGAAAAGAGDRAADTPEAGGLLSVELERLLLRLQREADDINAAYASCRADAMNTRGLAPLPAP